MTNKEIKPEESTKEKVLKGAFDLFSQKGMKDISMREIAEICGVTKPVIYYYFKDKDALCIEVVRRKMLWQEQKISSFAAASAGLGDFLERIFAGYKDNAANKQMVSFMMHFHSYASAHPEIVQGIHCHKEEHGKVLRGFLNNEVQKGALPKQYQEVALHLIFAVIVHLVLNSHEKQLDFSPTFAQDMSNAILRAVQYNGAK